MLGQLTKQETEFVNKLRGKIRSSLYKEDSILIDFLSKREQALAKMVCKEERIENILFDGGYNECERARAVINQNSNTVPNTYDIVMFEIDYNKKLNELTHSKILGSILALGIDRSLVGDIIFTKGGEVVVFVCKKMASYIQNNLLMIGKTAVKLKELKSLDNLEIIDDFEMIKIVVASLRLDLLIAKCTGISRNQAIEAINLGYIQKNWQIVNSGTQKCVVGDVLSIRKKGRFIIDDIIGTSKKGNNIIQIKTYKSK